MAYLKASIEKYLAVCSNLRGLSEHTIKAYRVDLAQFLNFVDNDILIEEISKHELSNFHHYLVESGLMQSSIKRKLACLKAMFRWFELEDLIEINPFHKFRVDLKTARRLPRNVPRSELQLLINQAQQALPLTSSGKQKAPSLHQTKLITKKRELNDITKLVALEIFIATGVRVSELASIRLRDVFIKEKKIKILGKGSRERYVFLPDEELCSLLSYYLQSRRVTEPENDFLLVNSRGKPASTQFLRRLMKELSQSAQTSIKTTPHMLRHSAACELLDSGLDIRYVQRLLGHSSISTTEIYTHVANTTLQEKLQKAEVRKRIMVS